VVLTQWSLCLLCFLCKAEVPPFQVASLSTQRPGEIVWDPEEDSANRKRKRVVPWDGRGHFGLGFCRVSRKGGRALR
jgi:hypothetical protein